MQTLRRVARNGPPGLGDLLEVTDPTDDDVALDVGDSVALTELHRAVRERHSGDEGSPPRPRAGDDLTGRLFRGAGARHHPVGAGCLPRRPLSSGCPASVSDGGLLTLCRCHSWSSRSAPELRGAVATSRATGPRRAPAGSPKPIWIQRARWVLVIRRTWHRVGREAPGGGGRRRQPAQRPVGPGLPRTRRRRHPTLRVAMTAGMQAVAWPRFRASSTSVDTPETRMCGRLLDVHLQESSLTRDGGLARVGSAMRTSLSVTETGGTRQGRAPRGPRRSAYIDAGTSPR